MITNIEKIKTINLFCDLKKEDMEQIVSLMETNKVYEGEIFMQRGEPASTFYVVLSGNYMIHFKEGQSFTLHEYGNIIGWSSVITPFLSTATGTALTDGELLCIPGKKLHDLLEKNPDMHYIFMKKINKIIAEKMVYAKDNEKI